MRRRAVGAAIVAALVVTGCGTSELRSAGQASEFIDDIARGKSGDWELAAGATLKAQSAWANREAIERAGQQLREESWACMAAERVGNAEKVVEGVDIYIDNEERRQIVLSSGTAPDQWSDVNGLIDDLLDLAPSEFVETVGAACGI